MNENFKKSFISIITGILVGLIPTYGLIIDKLTNKTFGVYKSIYFLMNFLTPIGGVIVTEFIIFALVGVVIACINKKNRLGLLLITTILVIYCAYFIKVALFGWAITLSVLFDLYIVLTILLYFVYMLIGSVIYLRFIKAKN